VATARVGVVRARPRAGATILVVRVDDADNRTISATDEEERARDDDENGPCNHTLPLPVAVGPVPVVVQPHATHGLEAHEGAQKCAHKRDETTEDGNGRRDDVSSQGDSGGEAKPGDPVPSSGVVEVLCSTQSTDEEVLGDELYEMSTLSVKSKGRRNDGTHMSDQDDGRKKTRKRESVANLLHQDTGRSQRRRRDVRSAVVVHDDADGDVDGGHDELAQRQGLEVVFVVLHLGHDVEVSRNTAEREDDTG
jgi:hypothetical protein